MLHLFNIFHLNKDSDNCAKVLEEECIRMFGTKSLNDEHDCNVISMNSLNIHSTNDDCTSHVKMSLISMSTVVEYIELASTHQIGKIDFVRGICT